MKTFIANILLILYMTIYIASAIGTIWFLVVLCLSTVSAWYAIFPIVLILAIASMKPTENYFDAYSKF